jgi:hypothetical protein
VHLKSREEARPRRIHTFEYRFIAIDPRIPPAVIPNAGQI